MVAFIFLSAIALSGSYPSVHDLAKKIGLEVPPDVTQEDVDLMVMTLEQVGIYCGDAVMGLVNREYSRKEVYRIQRAIGARKPELVYRETSGVYVSVVWYPARRRGYPSHFASFIYQRGKKPYLLVLCEDASSF